MKTKKRKIYVSNITKVTTYRDLFGTMYCLVADRKRDGIKEKQVVFRIPEFLYKTILKKGYYFS